MNAFEGDVSDNTVDFRLRWFHNVKILRTKHNLDFFIILKAFVHAFEFKSVKLNQIISDHNSFYNIGLSNEACYETVFGLVVNIGRRTDLLNFTVIHNDHGIRHGKGFLLVMRNVNEGNSNLPLDFFQLNLHLFSYFRIQGAKRLVKKKDFRLIYQRTGNGNSLLLSAGEQGDISFFETLQTYHFQHSGDFLGDHVLVHFFQIQTESNVLCHIQMGKKGIFLENGVYLSLIWRQLGNLNSVKQYFAAAWLLEACNNTKGCGLSTATWSQKGEKLVLIDVQIDSAENLLVIKVFCEVFQLYEFVHSCAPFRP